MNKRSALILILTLLSLTLKAQNAGRISGTIIDENTGQAIPGAVIELSPESNPDDPRYLTSEYEGKINVPSIRYGNYTMRISFLGYEDYTDSITVRRTVTDLGTIRMRQSTHRIDMIAVEGQAIRTSQRGDTVMYNADAFRVARDADAEGLLSKMPGITIIDGEVEAQGETVKRIYVDGREFFGDDVTTAIRNLPAEVIQRVEVYNKLSDQAQFTGIDDGEGFKALNFVTTITKGRFGKFYGTYGIEDKYLVGGNVNFFNGDRRISLLGLSNNLNQQNFAMEDILGAVNSSGGRGTQSRGGGRMRRGPEGGFMMRPQDGISKVHSLGINYTDKWAGKVELTASYFFNTTRNDNNSETDRRYYSNTDIYRTYLSTTDYWARNYENRFNARIEYKINEDHTLMWRPSVRFQTFKSENESSGLNELVDDPLRETVNQIFNFTDNRNNGYNLWNYLVYRARLGKPGRTLTVDGGGGASKNYRKGTDQTTTYIPGTADSLFRQRVENDNLSWNLRGSMVYTEPVSSRLQVTAEYRIRYEYSDADRRTYLWDNGLGMYDPDFSNDYSNIYNSGYLTQSVGPGLNFSHEGTVLNGSVSYQFSRLAGDRTYPRPATAIRHHFDNAVYRIMLNHSFNATNTLRVRARSYTNNPSVKQLQDVEDLTNTQFITAGNPNLVPSYNHNFFINYNRSGIEKGTTFMAMAFFGFEQDYIADSVTERADGSRYTVPVNMNGRWNTNISLSYGFPVRFLRSNVNFNAGAMFTEAPSYINALKNSQKGQYYNAGVVVGSNISERLDFTVNYNAGYSIVRNSINRDGDNTFFSQGASYNFKWEIWNGLTLTSTGTFTQYKGITDDYNEKYFICNIFIGKKILRNRRAEILFGVSDLLNQNTSFMRNVTDTYIENVRNSTIGRYFGFQFIYNLRNFGQGSAGNFAPETYSGPPSRPPGHAGPGTGR